MEKGKSTLNQCNERFELISTAYFLPQAASFTPLISASFHPSSQVIYTPEQNIHCLKRATSAGYIMSNSHPLFALRSWSTLLHYGPKNSLSCRKNGETGGEGMMVVDGVTGSDAITDGYFGALRNYTASGILRLQHICSPHLRAGDR